jgi:sulfatase maturation enzyme AslB (radical SAM superfamily)
MSNTITKLSPKEQLNVLSGRITGAPGFSEKMLSADLFPLKPTTLEIIQINMGYLCNQQCVHCHVDASPYRKEIMSKEIMEQCLKAIDSAKVKTVDLTGGAPEMNPHFEWFVEELAKRDLEIIVKSYYFS